jgi:F1F0 ATPase subunit 2
MSELFPLTFALAAGSGLGLFYFGGLWLTVKQLPTTRHPIAWTLGSLLVRLGVVLVGFYLIMGSHWERLLACLLTFLWVRNLMIRRLQVKGQRIAVLGRRR